MTRPRSLLERTLLSSVRVFCFAILMLGIASPAAAQDSDGDGIDDAEDNCKATANGPLPPGPNQDRVLQRDTDLDGFGNVCDADFNNDGVKGVPDYLIWLAAWGTSMGDTAYNTGVDKNDDGAVVPHDVLLTARPQCS